jgi:hypothetical protein
LFDQISSGLHFRAAVYGIRAKRKTHSDDDFGLKESEITSIEPLTITNNQL